MIYLNKCTKIGSSLRFAQICTLHYADMQLFYMIGAVYPQTELSLNIEQVIYLHI